MGQAWDNDKTIHVDMSTLKVTIKDFREEWKLLGGRALSAKVMLEECNPKCDPLGPENVLVFAPGTMSGTSAPTSGRISMGCKSPLTGGIKEANAGGNPGQDLMKIGYRAVIVTGQPADRNKLWGLRVSDGNAELVDATEYKGMWNYACCEKLLDGESDKASVISIGPAGEMMLKGASIACTDSDKDRRPARQAARGGVGAVMGSKCLKWVLVDPGKKATRKPVDRKAYAQYNKDFSKDYLSSRHSNFKYGTSAVVPAANMLHTFPYKNRIEGRNPEFEKLDGARIRESFESRGGEMHNCMTGCIVQCSNVVHDADGNYLTSALEFETLTLLGSCCAINNWEDVADLDRLCDELGLDTIETGAAIAVYMDSGGMAWGDAEGAKDLLRKELASGSELGKNIGHGALAIGTERKHHRIPVAKGQAMPAWDPRPLKATGITYASSAMGADHTAGLVIDPKISGDEAVVASQEIQIVNAICDSTGFCMFLGPTIDETRQFFTPFFGEEITSEQIADIGWQCLEDEWAFNDAAGFTVADDDMADCLKDEGIGPDQMYKFDVSDDLIAKAKIRQPNTESFYSKSPAG
ncbi:MAG: aldehyde ferredoxin oxidoreductase N-terminal domain-containing protein [Gammaproteobacteria bacterium]|nr:aldehyde ferredoxin oxidoreductase [Thiotrichales bacterium]